MEQQPDSNACFVCGRENPSGLKLEFFEVDGRVETTFTPTGHVTLIQVRSDDGDPPILSHVTLGEPHA